MRANPTSYDRDLIAWANEQARLLRAGRFDAWRRSSGTDMSARPQP